MKMLRLTMIVATGAVAVLCSCQKGSRYRFDHATKWYDYQLKRGPAIAGFTYEFDGDTVVARMMGASLHDELMGEYGRYRIDILQETPDGYKVVSESGSRGRLRFDGEDLILEWDDRDKHTPERRLTSVPPDFEKFRDQWKAETGTSVEDYFKDP